MKLWDYLVQATYMPNGAQTFLLGTADVQAWVNQNSGEIVARDKTIVDKIILGLRDKRQIVRPRLELHPMATHAATIGRGAPALAAEITGATVATDGQSDARKLGMYRRGIHAAVAVGMNMTQSPYPACKLYYIADAIETNEGLTRDFVNKHVSISAQSKKVARLTAFRRANPVRGNAPPASSTIDVDAWDDLLQEVKDRTKEFIATYEALGNYYVEKTSRYKASVQTPLRAFELIDGVTFVSRKRYPVHTHLIAGAGAQPVNQGKKDQYFRFSLSFSRNGEAWAIHHFASGRDDRQPEISDRLASRGSSLVLACLDEGTYFIDPIREV